MSALRADEQRWCVVTCDHVHDDGRPRGAGKDAVVSLIPAAPAEERRLTAVGRAHGVRDADCGHGIADARELSAEVASVPDVVERAQDRPEVVERDRGDVDAAALADPAAGAVCSQAVSGLGEFVELVEQRLELALVDIDVDDATAWQAGDRHLVPAAAHTKVVHGDPGSRALLERGLADEGNVVGCRFGVEGLARSEHLEYAAVTEHDLGA